MHWCHSFYSSNAEQIAKILVEGRTVLPADHSDKTRENQLILAIPEGQVYSYLGTLGEGFGKNAMALSNNIISGEVTPCDSGGLVRWIVPIRDKADASKRDFLSANSRPHSEFLSLFEQYPGPVYFDNYIQGKRHPEFTGPKDVWPGRPCEQLAIWHDLNTFQAWTWERRQPSPMITGLEIRAWTCPPDLFVDVREALESNPSYPDNIVEHLLRTYIPGGASVMVTRLITSQVYGGHT